MWVDEIRRLSESPPSLRRWELTRLLVTGARNARRGTIRAALWRETDGHTRNPLTVSVY